METIYNIEKEKCTGCSACFNICPRNAIYMKEDNEGFLYPEIDKELCIQCGKCYKVCPAINNSVKHNTPSTSYSISASDGIRKNSSSGGAFVLIAEEILKMGGYVSGAAYNEKFEVEHIIIDNIEDLPRLQGSKYVQSDLQNIFSQIKNILESNKYVLFSGTPCQVAGLNNFLQNKYEKLYTVDLVCHGVPSPKVFRKYLQEEIPKDENIQRINFRDKMNGWDYSNVLKIQTDKNIYVLNYDQSSYYDAFMKNLTERKVCSDCKYSTENRVGDFTIGDFWGINKTCPKLNDGKGLSIVLANSEKAFKLLKKTENRCVVFSEVPFKKAKLGNQVFSKPFESHRNRNNFYKSLDKISLKENVNNCLYDCADVGIINFWWFPNYGANLTAYSLQEVIKSFGFTTKLINYQHYWSTTIFLDTFYENMHENTFAQRFAEQYLDTTEPIKSEVDYKNLNNKINTFVVGSDQVFRDDFTGNRIDKYFLDFTSCDKKRIAFSASFGKNSYIADLNTQRKIENLLKRFDYISVREKSGLAICEKLFNVKADWTLEPVFLLDRNYWEDFASKSKFDNKGKIATYYFDSKEENIRLANVLQKKYTRDVTILNESDMDVEDFLKAIQTCDFLVTNSFHGVCFALLLNKQICLIGNNNNANRISSLFERFGIEYDFKIEEDDFDKLFINYNYENVCKNISEFRDFSLNRLKEALFATKTININVENIRLEQKLWELESKFETNFNEETTRYNQLNESYNKLQSEFKNTLEYRLHLLWKVLKIYVKQ